MAAAAAAISIVEQPHPEEEEEASWADLPSELVYLIMDKLSSSPHLIMLGYIRFGSVCTRWNVLFYDHNPLPQPPLLMISASLNNKKKKHKTRLRRFYNVCDNKMIDSSLQVRMPRYRYCRGSSHGWLITVDDDENNDDVLFSTRLLNPFMCTETTTGKYGDHEILLPSLDTFPLETPCPSLDTFPLETPCHYTFLVKAVLSANPLTNPTDYTVMSIYGIFNRLAFLKPGDKVWTSVKLAIEMNADDPAKDYFQDIIYWRDDFYAIQFSGRVVVVCEEVVDAGAEGIGMTAKQFTHPLKNTSNEYKNKKYLVASSEAKTLMQVHREIQYHLAADGRTTLYSTVGFRVFQLSILDQKKDDDDITTEDLYWAEVKTLGGDTMFLGHNTSISISGSSNYYPGGCKPNCIYYTDDGDSFYAFNQQVGGRDMGVFNLEDGSFQRHFPIYSKNNTSLQPIWPVPIWIQPTVPKSSNKTASTTSSSDDRRRISARACRQDHVPIVDMGVLILYYLS